MKKIYSIFKFKFAAFMLTATIFSMNANATVWPVPNDSTNAVAFFLDSLNDGTFRYAPGDTIMLTSSSQYHTNRISYIFQDVVVMGDPTLTVQPSFYFEDQGFRVPDSATSFELKNIKAIGWDPADSTSQANFLVEYKSHGGLLKIEEVEGLGFRCAFMLTGGSVYDSIVVNNCIFHDMSNKYNTFDFRGSKVKHTSITNNTVYNEPQGIIGEFWGADTSTGSTDVPFEKTLIIDHNTFYSVVKGSSFMAIHNLKDESLNATISNNIVSTLNGDGCRPFRYNTLAGSVDFKNNIFHDFVSTRYNAGLYYGLDQDSLDIYYPGLVTQTKTDTANPNFEDPAAASFMLADSSSLLGYATDGGAIGDPRWVPVAGVSIDALTSAVVVGTDVQLTATVNVSGDDKTVIWSVTNGTGSATIDASTGLLSPTAAGTITVKATSNFNNAFIDELDITVETKIYVTGISLVSKKGDTESTVIENKAGYLSIEATVEPVSAHDKSLTWSISDTNIARLNLKSNTLVELVAKATRNGTVTVTAAANDGSNVSESIDITISGQTSIFNAVASELQILPNPATDFIQLNNEQIAKVTITNILGSVVLTDAVEPGEAINIAELESGMYLVTVTSNNTDTTVRLIKE